MIIIDSSVWIDYLSGRTTAEIIWLEQELTRMRLGLTDLILCEVLQGIRSERQYLEVREELNKFQLFDTGGQEMALAAAENYRLLRGKGFTARKTIDCWIATFCMREGHALLHSDRDFRPFEEVLGLVVIHA